MGESRPVPSWVHAVAGGCGGAVGAIVTNPLEVVKTRLQSSSASMVKNVSGRKRDYLVRNLIQIFKNEGPKGYFKGLPAVLIGTIPSRTIYFWAYNLSKNYRQDNGPVTHIVSALSASSSQIILTTPIWVVRTKQQLNQSIPGYSFLRCASDIYKTNGFSGFFRGISASLFGMTETVIFFLIYEELKKTVVRRQTDESLRVVALFACSCTAKFICASLCYPHEVVRTRLREESTQTRYRGFFQTLKQVRLEEGYAGWYSGLRVHLLRVIPNNAIMMCVVETIVHRYSMKR